MKNTQTAALICRVSTKEQEEGYSLVAQEHLLRDYCMDRGLKPVLVLSFSETASKYTQRKKFQEFVSEVKKAGICHVVGEKVDRVSRSGSRDAVLMDEWVEDDQDRHLHLVKQSLDIHKYAPSSVKFVWAMHVAVAKHTSDNLSEEVRKTADEMLSRGIWPTKPVIGYLRDKANAVSPVQPKPNTSGLVRKMFELYDSGLWSVERLSFKMEEMGLLNSNGNRLMPSRVHELLQDPFYIGKMLYRGKVWQGAHEPIISYDLFERVQRRLRRKSGGSGAVLYSRHVHLLSGMAVCVGCNNPVSWERHGERNYYGYCKHYRSCPNRGLTSVAAAEDEMFANFGGLVVRNERLADWIGRALTLANDEDAGSEAVSKRELEAKLSALAQKGKRLLDLRLDGEIDKAEFEARREGLTAEKDRLTSALKGLDNPAPQEREDPTSIYQTGRRAKERYDALLVPERRDLIREIFSTVEVNGRLVQATYAPAYELLAKAVAATNSSKMAKSGDFGDLDFERLKIGSGKQKDHAFGHGHPVWLTAWEEFRQHIRRSGYGLGNTG